MENIPCNSKGSHHTAKDTYRMAQLEEIETILHGCDAVVGALYQEKN
jgi:hypothetical protein